jgi:serine O-acetyltransferase
MIKEIAERIFSAFDQNAFGEKQPEKAVIIDIIEKMRFIIFPEYFSKGNADKADLIQALEYVYSDLKSQGVSEEIADRFIQKIPAIRELLLTDVAAAYEGDPAAHSKAEIIISYPGIFAVMVQRIAHELYLLEIPLIPRIMTEHAHSITGIDIHPGATIGKYFFIDHGTGIVIGETAVIGEHVKIYQGVSIGALSTRGGQKLKGVKRHPTIEDNVTIYSGASILGGETIIGENTVIGGNAFVTKSVPEKTRVSVKNPELQFKNSDNTVSVKELEQDDSWIYII